MMKKITAISLILVLALSLGACGDKKSSEADAAGTGTSGVSAENGAVSGEVSENAANVDAAAGADASEAVSENTSGAAGENVSDVAGADAAGANSTAAAGTNGTAAAGMNGTGVAGTNTTTSVSPTSYPLIMNPSSMKMAYQPETEEQRYARELTGLYLLTDLKDTLSEDTGAKAAEMAGEGRPMYMEFFGNGTMQENVFGDPIGGLWDAENLTLGSDLIPYEFSGDHVTVTTDNMELTFTRTTKEELDLLLAAGKDSSDGDETEDAEADETENAAAGETEGAADQNGQENEEDSTAASTTENTAANEAENAAADETEDAAADGQDSNAQETGDAADTQSGIQEVLIEDDLCRMTATGYDFSDPRGFVIHVLCENYSIYNMAFSVSQAVVNNIMFEPGSEEEEKYWNMDVEPMSSREGDIIFRADLAAEYGITSYDYVLLSLWVRNLDDWMADPVYDADKEIYPTGKVTGEGIQNLERRKASGEQKIAEESKFTFTILGSEKRDNGDFVLKACIENLTWQNLMFSWDDVYVNGDLLDPFWAAEVLPHTILYQDIVFSSDDLRAGGVTDVSDIAFTMTAYDSKDWLSYSFYTETSKYRV